VTTKPCPVCLHPMRFESDKGPYRLDFCEPCDVYNAESKARPADVEAGKPEKRREKPVKRERGLF
jgi:hypothetical protein